MPLLASGMKHGTVCTQQRNSCEKDISDKRGTFPLLCAHPHVGLFPWCYGKHADVMLVPVVLSRLVGKIISRFEQRGYKLTALKLKQADEALLKTHYK